MPETTLERLPKSEVTIHFIITLDEAQPYLDQAVKHLSTAKPIPGFRPGKVTYEDAKRAYGEMVIYEAALEPLIRSFYLKALLQEDLHAVGSPSIAIDQLTPGSAIKFHATLPVEPTVVTFPDLSTCTIKHRDVSVTDEQVETAIEEMRKLRRSEVLVDRPATLDDLVIIDLEMKKDQVVLEGGSGQGYRVYLQEDHYIPGFTKELEGIRAEEARTFSLPFPKEHYQKHIAGKVVDFTATAKGVYALELPQADDAFAQGVGIQTIQELREKLRENLTSEQEFRAHEATEIEMLEKLVDKATFTDIPEILIKEETQRMLDEIRHGTEDQGMKWEDYLASIKKSADELRLDLAAQAVRRVKTAVLIKAFAKQQQVSATEEELDQEVDRILTHLREDDQETRERISSPEYREYIEIQLRNRKTLEWLEKECVR